MDPISDLRQKFEQHFANSATHAAGNSNQKTTLITKQQLAQIIENITHLHQRAINQVLTHLTFTPNIHPTTDIISDAKHASSTANDTINTSKILSNEKFFRNLLKTTSRSLSVRAIPQWNINSELKNRNTDQNIIAMQAIIDSQSEENDQLKNWISNEGKAAKEKCQHLQLKLDGYDQKLKNLQLRNQTLKEEMQYMSEKHQSSLQTNILLQERLSKQEIYIKMKENAKQSFSEFSNVSSENVFEDIQKELSMKNLDIANISQTNILIEQENKDLIKNTKLIEMRFEKICSENEKLQSGNHGLELQKIEHLETIEFLKNNNDSYLLQIQHLDKTLEEIHQQFSGKNSANTSVKNVKFIDMVSVDPYLSERQKSLFTELNIYSSLGSPEQILSQRQHYPQLTTDDVAFYTRYLSLQSTPNMTLEAYDNSEECDGREQCNEDISINVSLETVSESIDECNVSDVKKVDVVNENSATLVINDEPFKYNYGSNKELLLPKYQQKKSSCVCCGFHVF